MIMYVTQWLAMSCRKGCSIARSLQGVTGTKLKLSTNGVLATDQHDDADEDDDAPGGGRPPPPDAAAAGGGHPPPADAAAPGGVYPPLMRRRRRGGVDPPRASAYARLRPFAFLSKPTGGHCFIRIGAISD
jgi:hypothetical protein